MHFIKIFKNKTIKYDLINKFLYSNLNTLPKFKKIILSFNSKTADLKQLSLSLLAFEFVTNKRAVFTKTKKSNVLLKIRKGNPTGCKLILEKINVYFIFETFLNTLSNKTKVNLNKNIFSIKIFNIFNFEELKNYYYYFNNLSVLNITIITTCKNKLEISFLLRSVFKYNLTIKISG